MIGSPMTTILATRRRPWFPPFHHGEDLAELLCQPMREMLLYEPLTDDEVAKLLGATLHGPLPHEPLTDDEVAKLLGATLGQNLERKRANARLVAQHQDVMTEAECLQALGVPVELHVGTDPEDMDPPENEKCYIPLCGCRYTGATE